MSTDRRSGVRYRFGWWYAAYKGRILGVFASKEEAERAVKDPRAKERAAAKERRDAIRQALKAARAAEREQIRRVRRERAALEKAEQMAGGVAMPHWSPRFER